MNRLDDDFVARLLADRAPVDLTRQTCALSGSALTECATASPCAGKPSWSANARIDGVIRLSAPASARAIAVRFRNVSAVMPDDTCAKPDGRQ